MKDRRPGEAGARGGGEVATGGAAPGRQTLVQDLYDEPPAAAQAGQALDTGGAKVEGETLFSGPDENITAAVPAEGDATPEISDADYESTMGIKTAIDAKKMVPIAGINGKASDRRWLRRQEGRQGRVHVRSRVCRRLRVRGRRQDRARRPRDHLGGVERLRRAYRGHS